MYVCKCDWGRRNEGRKVHFIAWFLVAITNRQISTGKETQQLFEFVRKRNEFNNVFFLLAFFFPFVDYGSTRERRWLHWKCFNKISRMKTIKFETIKTKKTIRPTERRFDITFGPCLFLSQFSINGENMSIASEIVSLHWIRQAKKSVVGQTLFSGEISLSQLQLEFLCNFLSGKLIEIVKIMFVLRLLKRRRDKKRSGTDTNFSRSKMQTRQWNCIENFAKK